MKNSTSNINTKIKNESAEPPTSSLATYIAIDISSPAGKQRLASHDRQIRHATNKQVEEAHAWASTHYEELMQRLA